MNDKSICYKSLSTIWKFYPRVYHPGSGRVLEIFSSQPGVHFYTPNFTCGSLVGKHGKPYVGRSGFCIENQNYPNAINMVCSHLLFLDTFACHFEFVRSRSQRTLLRLCVEKYAYMWINQQLMDPVSNLPCNFACFYMISVL